MRSGLIQSQIYILFIEFAIFFLSFSPLFALLQQRLWLVKQKKIAYKIGSLIE